MPVNFGANVFIANVSSFQYRLNGALVATPLATTLLANSSGFFQVLLNSSNDTSFLTAGPIYSGPSSAPTLVPGVYSIVTAGQGVSDAIGLSGAMISVSGAGAAVPEPSTVGLGLMGLVGMWAWRRVR